MERIVGGGDPGEPTGALDLDAVVQGIDADGSPAMP
jgi:hypothetical protein